MRLLILALVGALLVGCGGEGQESESQAASQLSGKVRLDGSSTVFPISEAVAEEFGTVEPKVRVTVGVSGTGGGFKKFLAEEIDINNASRTIRASEVETAAAKGIQYLEIPVAFDGLSVVVSHDNDWVDYLTTGELNAMWKPGSEVEKWSDVRQDWPDEEVRLYGPGTDSGTFDYFTHAINGKEQAARPDFTASEDDNVLVQGIAGDKFALGYFGYAYYIENQDKLRVVPIDNGDGPVAPSIETITGGQYAPLSRPIFIYINPKSLDNAAVSRFASFYLEHAGSLAEEVGYVALSQNAYDRAMQRVEQREAGTAYGENATVANLTGN